MIYNGNSNYKLFIYWNLIDIDYYSVEELREPCIFYQPHLFEIIKRIFENNYKKYIFCLTGQNIFLYSHLVKLIQAISSHNNAQIILKFEISSEFFQVLNILDKLKNYKLKLDIDIIVNMPKIDELVEFLYNIITRKFDVNFRIAIEETNTNNEETKKKFLDKLNSKFLSDKDKYSKDIFKDNSSSLWLNKYSNFNIDLSPEENREGYVVLGTNLLCIEPNGTFSLAADKLDSVRKVPFWDISQKSFSRMPKIIKCDDISKLTFANNVLPIFKKEHEAIEFLNNFRKQNNIENVDKSCLTVKEVLHSRIGRILPAKNDTDVVKFKTKPSFITENFSDILSCYELFKDPKSKQLFLSAVKSFEAGNTTYIRSFSENNVSVFSPLDLKITKGEVIYTNTHDNINFYKQDIGEAGRVYILDEIVLDNNTIDQFILESGEICSDIIVESSEKIESFLVGTKNSIFDFQPRFCIQFNKLEDFIAIPKFFTDYRTYYSFKLYNNSASDTNAYFIAEPLCSPVKHTLSSVKQLPSISIIVFINTKNDISDDISNCLDSILVQKRDDIEILVLSSDSESKNNNIFENYVRLYPKIIRSVVVPGSSFSRLLTASLEIAVGKYITFLSSNTLVSWKFLSTGVENLEKENIDVVEFSQVFYEENSDKLYQQSIAKGLRCGKEVFEHSLLEGDGPILLSGRIFRTERLRHFRTDISSLGAASECAFALSAYYHARKVASCDSIGCYLLQRHESVDLQPAVAESDFQNFSNFVDWFVDFCENHNVELKSTSCQNYLMRFYQKYRNNIFSAITNARIKNRLDSLLNKSNLKKLSRSKKILSCLLVDCADLEFRNRSFPYRLYNKNNIKVSNNLSQNKYILNSFNSETLNKNTVLSVIIVANKENACKLQKTLETVLSQGIEDIDCHVVLQDIDECSEAFESLLDYSYFNPIIQIHTSSDVNQNVCRRLALDCARGRYVIFVEPGSLCLPDYFNTALSLIEGYASDAVFLGFNSQIAIDYNLSVNERDLLICHDEKCKYLLEEDVEELKIYGKIFDKSLMNNIQAQYSDFEFANEFILCYLAIIHSSSICINPKSYYQSNNLTNSDDYISLSDLHVYFHSWLYRNFDSLNTRKQSIDDRILGIIKLAFEVNHVVPVDSSDFQVVRANTNFLSQFLSIYANTYNNKLNRELFCDFKDEQLNLCSSNLSSEPYISLILPIFNEVNKKEIQFLHKNDELTRKFFTNYAIKYYNKYRKLQILSIDGLANVSYSAPAQYLIPYGSFEEKISEGILITIVIILKNNSRVINKCIDSIDNIDSVEILLIDDCSDQDDTFLICQAIQSESSRTRLYRTQWSSGKEQIRNLALKEANGSWILFLEPTDKLNHGFLERIVDQLKQLGENDPVDVIECSWTAYSEAHERVMFTRVIPETKRLSGREGFEAWVDNTYGNYGIWSKIFRKTFLEKVEEEFSLLCQHRSLQNLSDSDFYLFLMHLNARDELFLNINSLYHTYELEHSSCDTPKYADEDIFLRRLEELKGAHTCLIKNEYSTDSSYYIKVMQDFAQGLKNEEILLYIYILYLMKMKSPLTKDIISTLLISDVYIKNCIYNFKALSDHKNEKLLKDSSYEW